MPSAASVTSRRRASFGSACVSSKCLGVDISTYRSHSRALLPARPVRRAPTADDGGTESGAVRTNRGVRTKNTLTIVVVGRRPLDFEQPTLSTAPPRDIRAGASPPNETPPLSRTTWPGKFVLFVRLSSGKELRFLFKISDSQTRFLHHYRAPDNETHHSGRAG